MINASVRLVPMKLSVFLVLALALSNPISAQDRDDEEDNTGPYWTEEGQQQDEDYYDGSDCEDPSGLCTSTRIRNIRYNSDGTRSHRIGESTYHSDGSVCTVVGNITYCNECDGPSSVCTSTRIGNVLYNSDGTQSQRIGNRTYHSDGTVCTVIGNSTYCN
jgi:ribosomal protein L37E